MTREQAALSVCVRATTTITPRITHAVVKAAHASKPLAERERQLNTAIALAVELQNTLRGQRTLLQWSSRDGDAA